MSKSFLFIGVAVVVVTIVLLRLNTGAAQNPIQIENANAGTADWRLTKAASANEIVGYANLTSVNKGGQIQFFVSTPTRLIRCRSTGWAITTASVAA